MKSLEDLLAIKAKLQDKVSGLSADGTVRVLVGMATCGIAAGARPVLNALEEGVASSGLSGKVEVTQTGCIGICQYEPVVEVYEKGGQRTTYVKMTAEKAKEVVEKHLKGGQIVAEYTIGATQI